MILVDRSPTELVGVYEDEVVGKIAAAPWENDQTQRYGSDVGNSTAHTNLPDGRVDWYDGSGRKRRRSQEHGGVHLVHD